jgi:arginyl-tRNA--protein-N-Asp/Glu arginylyltransferase
VYHQNAVLTAVSDQIFEIMLANGWRRSAYYFYRYNREWSETTFKTFHVLSLRVLIHQFQMTKRQRKIWKKNEHTKINLYSGNPSEAHHELFELHKKRFSQNIPDSVFDFIAEKHAEQPTKGGILDVFEGEKLIASSFIDITTYSISSIYAMFHPDYENRSLGIFTMLLEIFIALKLKKQFYYPGFAHNENSFYDYKKRFHALEYFDWQESLWKPYPRLTDPTEKQTDFQ